MRDFINHDFQVAVEMRFDAPADKRKMSSLARSQPDLLPQEKVRPSLAFGYANDHPANPVARIFKRTDNDSPSPWGEGRDEEDRCSVQIHFKRLPESGI
jgi:hypothetical protein